MIKMLILYILFFLCVFTAYSQQNDHFKNALEIAIPANGKQLGVFKSTEVDLSNASAENNEFFHPLIVNQGLDIKSIWYKFEIPKSRSVQIHLRQKDTLIAQNAVGLTIYKNPNAYPNKNHLENALPVISKFGSSINTCTNSGVYYIQVVSNSKANAPVWIELEINRTSNSSYDFKKEAYNFSTINGQKSARIELGCLTTGKEDPVCTSSSSYNQSAWFKFKTDDFPDYLNIYTELSQSTNPNNKPILISLFQGDCTIDSNNLIEIVSCQNTIKNGCGLAANTEYSLQILADDEHFAFLELNLTCRGYGIPLGADPQALGSNYALGSISSNSSKRITEYINCRSRMSLYKCGTTIPGNIAINSNDSFSLHCLFTFTISKPTYLMHNALFYTDKNNTNRIFLLHKFRIFKGNIANNCNLTELTDVNKNCLEPGTYTLQMLVQEKNSTGITAKIELSWREILDQKYTIHYEPTNPEILGKLGLHPDSTSINPTVLSSINEFLLSKDTIIKIGDSVITGNFVFREFYLCRPSMVIIKEVGDFKNYFIKGSLKKQNGKARFVDSKYNKNIDDSLFFLSNCNKLKPGWYTIMGVFQDKCEHRTRTIESWVSVEILKEQKSNYNYPYKAYKILDLEPIDFSVNSGSPQAPRYRKTLTLPIAKTSCKLDSPLYWPKQCNLEKAYISYYVFSLKEKSFVLTDGGVLFPFNILKDSTKFLDTANAIKACYGSSAYCNLQPGEYTLLVPKIPFQPEEPLISISPVKRVKNNFAFNAYDLDILENGDNKSKGEFITCLAGMNETDYPKNIRKSISIKKSMPLTGKKSKNVLMDGNNLGNVWYTFLAKNAGEIRISATSLNGDYNFECFHYIVYEAPPDKALSFKYLKSIGAVDSMTESGLILVNTIKPNNEKYYTFNKTDCGIKRYYVLISFFNQFTNYYPPKIVLPNFNLQINCQFIENKLATDLGDYCSTAKNIIISDNDQNSSQIDLSCHSIGESFGEDGSNMSCLGDINNIKTTWIKVTYNGTLKNDLSFSITENTSALVNQIKYRVLYGSCESMTAGPCNESITGSFKLDCMAASDYYIQISSPKNTVGTINISAKSSTTKNQVCKPFDPMELKANFTVQGGCNASDPFIFDNLSSQGNQISYLWDFGDGETDTIKTPKHIYKTTGSGLDSFTITLKVYNKILGKKAQISKQVYVFNNLKVKMVNDTTIFCNPQVRPNPQFNFKPTEIKWTSKEYIDSPFIAKPLFTRFSHYGSLYYLEAIYKNCVIQDSIKIYSLYKKGSIHDYKLCEGKTLTFGVAKDTFPIFEWSTGDTTEKITITQEGKYYFKKGYNINCLVIDTYNVETIRGPEIKFSEKPNCLSDLLVVEPILPSTHTYLWYHNGSTYRYITVYDTGWYKVRVKTNTKCPTFDSFFVSEKNFLKLQLYDTLSCENPVTLDAQIDNVLYKWSTGDSTKTVTITKSGTYNLIIKTKNCRANDSVNVAFTTLPNLKIESFELCDSLSKEITLNPKYKYKWFDQSEGNKKEITKSSSYWVEAFDDHCFTKLFFNGQLNMSPEVDLGADSAVCLPFVSKIKYNGQADSLFWSTGIINQKYIEVTDTGLYWLTAKNNNCENSDTIYINLDECFTDIFIPNSFTPQNKNPFFLCKGTDISEFEMRIYNRWGEHIFTSNDINIGWDGTFKNEPCQMDIYIYIINYKLANQASKTVSGGLSLLR